MGARYVPDQLVRDVGQRIAEVRRERGITQAVLAERLRYSVQHVSQLENGTNITLHTLARIANALEARLEELIAAPRESRGEVRRGRPAAPRNKLVVERKSATQAGPILPNPSHARGAKRGKRRS